jgi:hypothetical protein
MKALLDLYRRLAEAERQAARGAKSVGHRAMMRKLRARIR